MLGHLVRSSRVAWVMLHLTGVNHMTSYRVQMAEAAKLALRNNEHCLWLLNITLQLARCPEGQDATWKKTNGYKKEKAVLCVTEPKPNKRFENQPDQHWTQVPAEKIGHFHFEFANTKTKRGVSKVKPRISLGLIWWVTAAAFHNPPLKKQWGQKIRH